MDWLFRICFCCCSIIWRIKSSQFSRAGLFKVLSFCFQYTHLDSTVFDFIRWIDNSTGKVLAVACD